MNLVQDKAFDRLHADFCSRLAMTFSHGDYADISALKGPETVAEHLYKKALGYHADHRAYLGLSMLYQKQRKFEDAMQVLKKGLFQFPGSFDLSLCQAVNHMNTGSYKSALPLLLAHEEQKTARAYIAQCYEELGDYRKAAAYRDPKG